MALLVSQSLASSHPLDQDATKAVGVTLPLTKGYSGWFNQTHTTAAAIHTDLQNLLLTQKGERALNPEFGSDLWKVVFEQNTEELSPIVEDIVKDAVKQWMPFVQINAVNISRENKHIDIYKLKIEIWYYVPNVVGLTTLSLLVE